MPHSSEPRPGSLEVPGMGLRPCGTQVVFTAFVPVFWFARCFWEFPTELVTSEAHPYSPQVRARRWFRYLRPVRSRVAAELGQRLQQSSSFPSVVPVVHWGMPQACVLSFILLQPIRGRRTRFRLVNGLTGLNEAFRHSWYQSKVRVNIRELESYIALFQDWYTVGSWLWFLNICCFVSGWCFVCAEKFEMADRRDWGGGGDDPEENTQRMIERIWESLTDIRARMDQQAPVPPVAVPPGVGGAVHRMGRLSAISAGPWFEARGGRITAEHFAGEKPEVEESHQRWKNATVGVIAFTGEKP
ncbi:hypothetical protein Taro_034880 [Colocasia esculenta]|uniref:Uncharacterized protein n=1 Tax=Colocasia esculenta TaxID=4460 RepID=A0A843W553_COLES|nr:hypothetical protein [Colocasia esculenta]